MACKAGTTVHDGNDLTSDIFYFHFFQIGRTKGGMNTKLHAVADAEGQPIGFLMSDGQVSDDAGAAALLGSLPKAGRLLADRGHDADWFREALKDKGIKVCIPGVGSLARRW